MGWLLVLAGLVFLGYEVASRVSSASKAAADPSVGPTGARPSTPMGPIPAVVSPFEDPPRLVDTRMTEGQRYRMRFDATRFDPETRFTRVTTYATPDALPADWPPTMTLQADTNTHFAQGIWPSASALDPRPDGLYQVWPTASTAT